MAPSPEPVVMLHPVFGHDEARAMVARSHRAGHLPSSMLLHGPKGVGKQRFALWIAQLSVCEEPLEAGPCGACRNCRLALALEHPDVHWYMPLPRPKKVAGDRLADALEDARHEVLAQHREHPLQPSHTREVTGLYIGTVKNLRKRAHVRPSMAPGPVFIVGDAELLVPQEASQEAANALLKLLEEPPGEARFILTSSVPGSLLPTIRSRTVPLHLAPIPEETLRSVLMERLELDEDRARNIARLGQGSLGRALGFLPDDEEHERMNELRRGAFDILRAALDRRRSAYALALAYSASGARGLIDLLEILDEWIRDLGAVVSGSGAPAFHHDTTDVLRKLAAHGRVHAAYVPRALPVVERAKELARGNVNPQLVVAGLVRELGEALTSSHGKAAR